DKGKAVTYKGNYSQFLVERAERREQQQREFENQQSFIAKNEDFVRRNLAGQKTKLAKSRRNMLERLERVEAVSVEKSSGNFNLKKVERAGLNVLTAEDLAIGYGTRVLAKDINFTLNRGECLGIIGGNGTGKTTFLKTILGNQRELAGALNWGTKTNIGYYAQNLEDLDSRNEIVQELRRVAPTADNGELRSFLARFLFTGEDIFKRVADLSGGEKGRLALAKLIYSGVNVLVLDEPTNHLDIPSREALESALENYPGTILAVSHDRYFLDQISTQIFSFEADGKTEVFDGNYSEFHDWKLNQSSVVSRQPSVVNEKVESELQTKRNGQKTTDESLSKNQRQKIEKRIKEVEKEISQAEGKLASLSTQMSEPENVSSPEKYERLSKLFAETENDIQKLYAEWEKLSG
ncbi:MAG: ABC-F family ATP-binding cassette domain-containing protein, partial [Acidobacteriota bacterium]|nr:ABC-F family ATP-binding cassette domain-containing protein [Acidobacteriota bacterium]